MEIQKRKNKEKKIKNTNHLFVQINPNQEKIKKKRQKIEHTPYLCPDKFKQNNKKIHSPSF